MSFNPKVSVVLGTYNRLKYLKLTIDSIRKELNDFEYEIIVIDGGSTDGTIKWLTSQKDILSIIQHNRGVWNNKQIERKSWGYFMNLGFKAARAKYICMVSDDCLIIPNSIINGYNFFEEKLSSGKKVGAVPFYWRDWPLEETYGLHSNFGQIYVNHGLYLKKALEEINYIDEDTYKFYCADSDLCLRLNEAGYSCIPSKDSYIEHYSHANMQIRNVNQHICLDDYNIFKNKWQKKFDNWTDEQIFRRVNEINYIDSSNIYKKFELLHKTNSSLFTHNFKKQVLHIKNLFLAKIKFGNKKTTEELKFLLKKKNTQSRINKLAKIYKGKKIIIYGAGILYKILNEEYNLSELDIVAITDKSFTDENKTLNGYEAINPLKIKDYQPDVIILATYYPNNIIEYLSNNIIPFLNKNVKIDFFFKKSLYERIFSL